MLILPQKTMLLEGKIINRKNDQEDVHITASSLARLLALRAEEVCQPLFKSGHKLFIIKSLLIKRPKCSPSFEVLKPRKVARAENRKVQQHRTLNHSGIKKRTRAAASFQQLFLSL